MLKKSLSFLSVFLVVVCIILLVGCNSENQNSEDKPVPTEESVSKNQTIDDPIVLSILSSYTLALDDYYDNYVRGQDVLVYLDAIQALLEQADSMGISDSYPDLLQLMTAAYEDALNADLASFIIHSNDLNQVLSDSSSEATDEAKIRSEALGLLMDW